MDQWFRRASFTDISHLELWQPPVLSLAKLCNFGRSHHEEQFCEIILNLDQWFRSRCLIKMFLIWSSEGHFVQLSGTIFVRGIKWNKFFEIILSFGPVVQEEISLKDISYIELCQPLFQQSKIICAILEEGIMSIVRQYSGEF